MKYDISISGTIGWDTSAGYIKYMLNQQKGKRCDVRICSLGGYVTDGMDIYQMFKDHGDVHCHFVGMSASAATFLAMGAKEVTMDRHALILIHNASSMQFAWGSYNKEQLDELIKNLGKEREQLNTIDDCIASIYADRCKKDIEEVKEKMKVAAWINAEDAKTLGIVDSITDVDAEEMKEINFFNSLYSNDKLTELGLPLPPSSEEEHPTASESILVKVAQLLGLKKPQFTQPTNATTTTNTMLKIFACVAALLAVDGFALNDKDNIELTQDQLKALDDAMKQKEDKISNLQKEIDDLKKQTPASKPEDVETINDLTTKLNKALEDIKAKDQQIENLKKAPATDTTDAPASTEEEATGAEFVNLYK